MPSHMQTEALVHARSQRLTQEDTRIQRHAKGDIHATEREKLACTHTEGDTRTRAQTQMEMLTHTQRDRCVHTHRDT